MISPRITCFVYFALLFGTAHANTTTIPNSTHSGAQIYNMTIKEANTDPLPAPTNALVNMKPPSVLTKTQQPIKTQQSVCTPAAPEPTKGQCILLLPTGDSLQMVVFALTVGCLILLLTTLICAYQVCHLRGILSSLHLRHNSVDQRAIREKSELPYKNEGQVDGQPTETCIMLSEVTTAQEESREDEESSGEQDRGEQRHGAAQYHEGPE